MHAYSVCLFVVVFQITWRYSGELFIQMQIKFPCEWMNNSKDNSPENIRDLKQAINIRSRVGLVILKMKQAKDLRRISANNVNNFGESMS